MERNNNNNCVMVTNAGISALKEEEIELELGLSIGGSYRKRAENFSRVENGSDDQSKSAAIDVGLKDEKHANFTSVSTSFVGDTEPEIDLKTKGEIHALRRQEAKKKREGKQLRKAGFCRNNGGYFNGGLLNGDDDNGFRLKPIDFQVLDTEERERKKGKKEESGSVHLNLAIEQTSTNCDSTSYPLLPPISSPVRPLSSVQHPNPQLQYGLPVNGFVHPNGNVMPSWLPGGAGVGMNGNVVHPVASYGFEPFNEVPEAGRRTGYDSEQNVNGDAGSRKSGSNGSAACTSSVGSDHKSSSLGGGSSDRRSHSSHSLPEQQHLSDSKAKDSKGLSEHSVTSHIIQSALVNDAINHAEKVASSNGTQSSPSGPNEESKSESEPDSAHRHMSSSSDNALSSPLKDSNGETGKPPKLHSIPSYPQMPCVSTTGNGPNGKTINGFLYRYTKSEVSIICVCHGSSFTPAEFVQHSGATDVSHPLRHITVIPSSF